MKDRLVQICSAFALPTLLSAALLCSAAPVWSQNDAASLYKSKCAGCHAPDGTASTPAGKSLKIRDLHSADVQKQTDAQLTDIITAGKSPMPAYKDKLTGDQIKQLVGYIRDMGKK
jgi:mono/diheme cytochrome c family protein